MIELLPIFSTKPVVDCIYYLAPYLQTPAEILLFISCSSVQGLLDIKEVLVVEQLKVELRVVVLHVHGRFPAHRADWEGPPEHHVWSLTQFYSVDF